MSNDPLSTRLDWDMTVPLTTKTSAQKQAIVDFILLDLSMNVETGGG